jgi:hypothetical protein
MLAFYWLKISPIATPNCQEDWDVPYSSKPKKKNEVTYKCKGSLCFPDLITDTQKTMIKIPKFKLGWLVKERKCLGRNNNSVYLKICKQYVDHKGHKKSI